MTSAGNIWGTAMATAARHSRDGRIARWREGFRQAARRSGRLAGGLALSLGAVFALLALVSYRPSDPAFNTKAGGPVGNLPRATRG